MDRAKILSDRVELVGDQSHSALNEAHERVEKLEQELLQHSEEAKAAFQALTQKAHDFEGQVADLLAKLQEGVDRLGDVREEIHGQVQQEAEHHKQELASLAGMVEALEHKLEDHWSEAHDEIKGFLGQVDEHLDEFKEHHEDLLASIEHFHEGHSNLFQEMVDGMEQFSSHSGDLLNGLVGHLEGLTDEHTTQLVSKFGTDVVEHLLQASDPLSGVFSVVNELAGGSHESFLGKFEEITGSSEQVAEIINQIKPALDLIEEML